MRSFSTGATPMRDAARRPFAGIVDEIADHLLEVLLLAAEARRTLDRKLDGQALGMVDLFHGPHEALDDRRHLGDGADDADRGGDAGALQMVVDLRAHHLDLMLQSARRRPRR